MGERETRSEGLFKEERNRGCSIEEHISLRGCLISEGLFDNKLEGRRDVYLMRDAENRRRGEDYGRENRRRGRLSTGCTGDLEKNIGEENRGRLWEKAR
ncbi:hypothetical protein L6452_43817 [Arctium lappa]|uniref:Uncharacterized protein n=1 Tax=Arctium lappa TaxID=4217 RepID=A0ACB8XEC0_ARCLA|nr:hypothetical protein L6452_43817 [Arctium lappa]